MTGIVSSYEIEIKYRGVRYVIYTNGVNTGATFGYNGAITREANGRWHSGNIEVLGNLRLALEEAYQRLTGGRDDDPR